MLARLLLVLSACLIAAPAAAETVVIHTGRLITDASKPPMGPSTLTVVDGRISGIADGHTPVPAGAELGDPSSKTTLPGLPAPHVHLPGEPGGAWRAASGGPPGW